jgi:hypothetical protein
MNKCQHISKKVLSAVRILSMGIGLSLSVFTYSESAAAQTPGAATSSITLNLVVGSTGTTCGFGSVSAVATGTTTQNEYTPQITSGTGVTSISNVVKGTSGIQVYCPTTFFISADGGKNASGSYKDADISRYLYTSAGAQKYQYLLSIGHNAPTTLAAATTYPNWSGSTSTSCTVAYIGGATQVTTTTASGGTYQSTTYGCYKALGGTGTGQYSGFYVPFGYYIYSGGATTYFNTAGTFTDTVGLYLFY